MPESTERGALTEAVYYILLSLYAPLHGYGIMQHVEKLSGGRVCLGAGTLYGALNTLLERGLIRPAPSPEEDRKKAYAITEAGKRAVADEIERLRELIENGRAVTGGSL